jgi:uncharacterized protein YndB with AHSA1/START domain
MKNFDWTRFTLRIVVTAKLEDLYNAWTRSSEITKWFLSGADYYNDKTQLVSKDANIQEGDTYQWTWYLYDVVEKGRITEANGIDHLQFTFAGECLVDIKLTQKGEHILVELTQKDIPTDEDSKKEIRLGCHQGWSFYLVNLKSVYEGGLDLRNKLPEFRPPMVNN